MAEMLTDAELVEFTRAPTPTRQRNVLKEHGIKFVERADGTLAVTWTAINHALTSSKVDHKIHWDKVNGKKAS